MNNTYNIYKTDFEQEEGAVLLSQNAEREFVNTETWNLFKSRFRSPSTEASYWSDIMEFCRFSEKNFNDADQTDVRKYYEMMKRKTETGKISPITVTKKFRELHSFAEFSGREDFFFPYLKYMPKEKNLAKYVPPEDMDALLAAASEDRMAYTILTLMYRAGMSSTEIISLNGPENFVIYDDGPYALLDGREEACCIPEDAWKILMEYMDVRDEHESLFYNRSGRRLNTMYISRMMKRYCTKAGIPSYSAEAVRNCCAFNLFSYGASTRQTAAQMGRTEQQIRRYRGTGYKNNLRRQADRLVRVRIESP